MTRMEDIKQELITLIREAGTLCTHDSCCDECAFSCGVEGCAMEEMGESLGIKWEDYPDD